MMGRGADGGCGTEERPCPASRASSSALSGPSGRAVDLYAQARKALTERSPFAGVEETLRVATLPISLAGSLARHGDGRRKKAHADEHGKKAVHAPQLASGLWDETEEYFRSVTLSDIDLLELRLRRAGDACLHIPINCRVLPHIGDDLFSVELEVQRDDTTGIRVDEAEVAAVLDGEPKEAEQEQEDMEIDEMDDEQKNNGVADGPLDEEIVEEQRVEEESGSKFNWLLTSRHRALLTSERPNKKRKLLGSDAGLERVLRLPPPEGEVLPLCDYCCNQAGGGKLDWSELVSCRSCEATVHRKCYGVQDSGAWACARCKYLEEVGKPLNGDGESSCLLCPREAGALKLVEEDGSTVNEGVRFAHLFCSLWMPELYVEREETMGPIMNVKEIPESRMKLVCNVCKVKHGACVRCSNGVCRASFHPSCARGAKHKMEIWGKVGCDNVELRAFCAKHSDVQESSRLKNLNMANGTPSRTCKALATGSSMNSPIGDKGVTENEKHAGDDALASDSKSDLHESCDDESMGFSGTLSDSCSSQLSKFILVLKKLTEIGKVKVRDVESETGISSEALNSVLQGDSSFLSPDLQLKLIKWVRDSDYIDAFPRILKSDNNDALSANESENNVKHAIQDLGGSDALCIAEGDSSDVIVKSLPPRRRTRGNLRIVKENEVDTLPSGIVTHRDHTGEMCYDDAEIPFIFDDGVKEDHAFRSIIDEVHSKDKENLKSLVDDGSSKITPSTKDLQPEKGYAIIPPSQGKHSFSRTCDRLSHPNDELVLAKAGVDTTNEVSLMTAFAKAKELGITEHSPEDELEGEIINLQNKLLDASIALKSHYDNLILKVVSGIPDELEVVKKQRWDMVFVNRFLREVKEAKKRGRKERRQKEAQAILAAATAAANSSRVLSIRKDAKEEVGSGQEQRRKDKPPKLAVSKLSSGKHSDANVFSCDICRRQETLMKPIFVCAGCKVAVHLNCYRTGKDPISSWYCEPCELKFDSYGSEPSIEYRKKLSCVPQCSLCGATTGAFRKSTDGKWVHAFCAEWVLGSRFRRGQEQPVEGVDTLLKTKELLSCCICHQNAGICIKCCYGHCQTAFHPICARGAGLFMNARTIGGNIQHKAYCEKHSQEQREKAEYQHGVEEFKNLRQTRVELEKLRLLCERIIKREKLKRELVVCSHEILSSRRDYVAMSVIARSPFLSSGFSSESATTSINNTSYSGTMERSDDVTVDSTLSGKRRAIPPLHIKFDRSGEASVRLNPPSTRMVTDRTSVSGKQLPQRPASYDKPVNEGKRTSKRGKIREILQTADQTSSQSQRLPKGFVHASSENMSKSQDVDSCEPLHPDG